MLSLLYWLLNSRRYFLLLTLDEDKIKKDWIKPLKSQGHFPTRLENVTVKEIPILLATLILIKPGRKIFSPVVSNVFLSSVCGMHFLSIVYMCSYILHLNLAL